jgi:hypothetical protein
MATTSRKPVSQQEAHSLRTLVIASKLGDNHTYKPPFRTVAVIVPERLSECFPGFLVEESVPARPGTFEPQQSIFYRVDTFEDVASFFAEPLPG